MVLQPCLGTPDTRGLLSRSKIDSRIQHTQRLPRPGNSPASTHEKRTDIRVLELFASTRREPWSHTHQERKRLLLHPPEGRMRRGQCKSTFNNRKPNMTPPETRNHTPPRPEHHNADEPEENDLKNIFRKMIENLKEDILFLREVPMPNKTWPT